MEIDQVMNSLKISDLVLMEQASCRPADATLGSKMGQFDDFDPQKSWNRVCKYIMSNCKAKVTTS